MFRIGSRGGGVLGVRTPLFWGTPKLHIKGKNVVRMRAKTPRFRTVSPISLVRG